MKTQDAIPAATSAGEPARLVIDLAALRHNYSVLAELAAGARCAAVVKADAYGLDADRIATCLRDAGCRDFFTATPEEGAAVRRALGPSVTVYVLNGYQPGTYALHARHGLTPVIGSLESLQAFHDEGSGAFALHVDTGMNRLGLNVGEALALPAAHKAGLHLVMSHLACSDLPDHPMNARQLERFHDVLKAFPGIPASLANTGGVLLGPDYHFDLVRPGVGLYGVNPASERAEPFRPVLHVDAPILQVRTVPPGETIGYGARYVAQSERTVAIAGFGYADGLPRAAWQSGTARLDGHPVPVAGMVSMDLTALDITGHEALARASGRVQFYGEDLGPVAGASGTIGYELLVRLGSRLKREYRGQ
ncbi:alanine racemase [Glycocaulis alkaliphilus]|uniref:Alanine racemase n=1 Tax=Glycocaulis alkaliphilus TaxID=1434191 RepID=A0A3T0E7N9_9PROT|nr:alanine racemase [Glycocaulis alkaliphilus]AZU03342.1 alanine racemase [Glycocaulis alkaliphilus]